MRILVTGSAGHLGEALIRTLRAGPHDAVGLDQLASPFTDIIASITDASAVRQALCGIDAVLHTATLHKPHVATHAPHAFVDTNVSGTLHLLEAAVAARVRGFVFSSSTSVFGDALVPAVGRPAAWITEAVVPAPKNIYGVTKAAAEDLCQLYHRNRQLACIVLRVARFFPEVDDAPDTRVSYEDANVKANEFTHRRVAIDDVVSAHLCALERAPALGFGRYIISAPPPFAEDDCERVRVDAPAVLARRVPAYVPAYARRRWRMFPHVDRIYSPARALADLGWSPTVDFAEVVARLATGSDIRSPFARQIGVKGYHGAAYPDGRYPIEHES